MDAEEDMMEDIFDWAIYDSLNDSPLPNNPLPLDPPSLVATDDDINLNDFVDANDLQLDDLDSDHSEGDLQTDGEPEPARVGALLGDWVTPGPRKGGHGKRNKRRKSAVEGGWEFVDKEELLNPQDWEVVPDDGKL